ncbi:hypothetical protein [Salibacterium aidingense]
MNPYKDEGVTIGKSTKVLHFSHIIPNAIIGENCNLGCCW